jgi:hypothetical protein
MRRIFGLECMVWRQQDGELMSQYRRRSQGPLVYLALKGIITFAYGQQDQSKGATQGKTF